MIGCLRLIGQTVVKHNYLAVDIFIVNITVSGCVCHSWMTVALIIQGSIRNILPFASGRVYSLRTLWHWCPTQSSGAPCPAAFRRHPAAVQLTDYLSEVLQRPGYNKQLIWGLISSFLAQLTCKTLGQGTLGPRSHYRLLYWFESRKWDGCFFPTEDHFHSVVSPSNPSSLLPAAIDSLLW